MSHEATIHRFTHTHPHETRSHETFNGEVVTLGCGFSLCTVVTAYDGECILSVLSTSGHATHSQLSLAEADSQVRSSVVDDRDLTLEDLHGVAEPRYWSTVFTNPQVRAELERHGFDFS